MGRKLDRYRSMRDLDAGPEPDGSADPATGADSPRFVVQEHHARRLHWDLRLEHDGVLASWALPRGIPSHPQENRLAVRTEDHPLEYLTFEGEIPAGTYGAGTMEVWDSGTYSAEKFREDEVIVTLNGERVSGRYVLFRTRGKDWMIHRMDPPADPAAQPMPDAIAPMLARLGKLPRKDADHGFEIKWDGVRATAEVDAGHLTLTGRNGTDFTPRYPEVRGLADHLGSRRLVLDGEVVALDSGGRPSFERLQSRMHLGSQSAVRRRMKEIPVTYVIFDLLWLEGHSTLALPYRDRRKLLAGLELEGPGWRTPAHREGDGAALLAASEEQGLGGSWPSGWIPSTSPDAAPGPGSRSRTTASRTWWWEASRRGPATARPASGRSPWVCTTRRAPCATPARWARASRRPPWESSCASWRRCVRSSPFAGRQPPRGTVFVQPRLVARVEFGEWTRTAILRAPSFKGLAADVDPASVVRET